MTTPLLGTAPRRVGVNNWVTRSGAKLSPAAAQVWEGYFHAGQTDGYGHFYTKPAAPHVATLPLASGKTISVAPRLGESHSDYLARMHGLAQGLDQQAQGANLAVEHPQTSAFSLPRIGQVIDRGTQLAEGIPIGLGHAAVGTAQDIADTAQGHPTLRRSLKDWVVDPAKAALHVAEHPGEDPLATAVTAASLLAGGKSVATRLSSKEAAAPAIATLEHQGVKVPLRTPRAPLAGAMARRRADVLNQELAGGERLAPRLGGNAEKQLGAAIRHREELVGRIPEGEAANLESYGSLHRPLIPRRAGKNELSVGEQKAADVYSSGVPIELHLRAHAAELQRANDYVQALREQGAPDSQIAQAEKSVAGNARQLEELRAAHQHITNPSPTLQKAILDSRRLIREREGILGVTEEDRFNRLGARVATLSHMAGDLPRNLLHERSDLQDRLKVVSSDLNRAHLQQRLDHVNEQITSLGKHADEQGGFYVPSRKHLPTTASSAIRAARPGGVFGGRKPPEMPPEMKHQYTGWLQRTGNFNTKVTGLVAHAYRGAQKLAAQQRGFDILTRLGKPASELSPDELSSGQYVMMRRSQGIPEFVRDQLARSDQGALTAKDREAAPALEKSLHDYYTNTEGIPPEDLVAVPKDIFSQVAPEQIRANGMDKFNSLARAGMLFTTPKYIVNFAQQMGTAALQQGVHIVRNAKLLGSLDEIDRQRIFAAAGAGSRFKAIQGEASLGGRITGGAQELGERAGEFWSKITDRQSRALSWVHEAYEMGYDTPQKIHDLLVNPNKRNDLFQVTARGDSQAVPFSEMSPLEKRTLKRAILFYPWLRGSAVWSARFPLEHPNQAAYYAQIGQNGSDYAQKAWGGPIPAFLRGHLPLGGGQHPWTINPQMLSNWSTPTEFVRDISDTVQGKAGGGAIGNLQPAYDVLYAGLANKSLATDTRPKGPIADNLPGGVGSALEEAASTLQPYSVGKKAVKSGGVTEGGPAAAASQFALGSATGGPVDLAKAHSIGERERRQDLGLSGRVKEDLQTKLDKIDKLGISDQWKAHLHRDVTLQAQASEAYQKIEKSTNVGPQREAKKLDALLTILKDTPEGKSTAAYFTAHPDLKQHFARQARRWLERNVLDSQAVAWLNKQKGVK